MHIHLRGILNPCSTKIIDGDVKWCLDASTMVVGLLLPFSLLLQQENASETKKKNPPFMLWIPLSPRIFGKITLLSIFKKITIFPRRKIDLRKKSPFFAKKCDVYYTVWENPVDLTEIEEHLAMQPCKLIIGPNRYPNPSVHLENIACIKSMHNHEIRTTKHSAIKPPPYRSDWSMAVVINLMVYT